MRFLLNNYVDLMSEGKKYLYAVVLLFITLVKDLSEKVSLLIFMQK